MATSAASKDWSTFIRMARPRADWSEAGRVLCLDPGLTTGWAIFDGGELDSAGQWDTPTPTDLARHLQTFEAAGTHGPYVTIEHIVYETYRIRGNKAKEHIGSEVVTIQHIGAIKVVADDFGIPITGQSAGMAKGFATDAKLRRWGLWQLNHRHANDAVRHGCYWHLFHFAKQ